MSSKAYTAKHEGRKKRGQTRRSSKAESSVGPNAPLQVRRVANIACSGVRNGKLSPDVDSRDVACGGEEMKSKLWTTRRPCNTSWAAVGVCCVERWPCARATCLSLPAARLFPPTAPDQLRDGVLPSTATRAGSVAATLVRATAHHAQRTPCA